MKQIDRNDYMSYMQPKDVVLDEIYLNQAMYDRTIIFSEEFDRESCWKALYFLERIEKQDDMENIPIEERKPIAIKVNSYGGSVYDCFALVSVIERMKDRGYKVNTQVVGIGMSCGFILTIVGSYRTMARYGYIMCHQVSSMVGGELQRQEEDIEHTRELQDKICEIIMKYTNMTKEQLDEIKKSKIDYYLDAEKALQLGCIDEIL